MPKVLSYKIILRGSRGGLTKISSAKSYELYYGKKRILKNTPFHFNTKTVKHKRNFLQKVIKLVEKNRLEKNRITQLKRAKKIAEARRLKNKKLKKVKLIHQIAHEQVYLKDREQLENTSFKNTVFNVQYKKSLIKTNVDFSKISYEQYQGIDVEEVDPAKTRVEEPLDTAQHHISMAEIVPFKPKSIYYIKELIYKEIMRKADLSVIVSTTLKVVLKPKYIFPITIEDFRTAKIKCFAYFLPHMRDFFLNMGEGLYILRVTFRRKIGDKMVDQGMSDSRVALSRPDDINAVISSTLDRFITPDERRLKRGFIKNYLQDSTYLEITGFTIEQQDFYKTIDKKEKLF